MQPGIPVDNKQSNELTAWLEAVKQVVHQERGKEMRVSILCDKDTPYPQIAMLTDNLQRHGVNRVSLITQAYHYGVHDSYQPYL